jgi:hypothetical protein
MLRMMSTMPGASDPASEDRVKTDDLSKLMDESGQGPKRAEAKAIACLLRIQPSIQSTEGSSSKRPVAKTLQL